LISIPELQRLKKDKGEALILHGRHYPFVSELPDIDDYEFKTLPPFKAKEYKLPEIVPYIATDVISEIKGGDRPIAFSIEVHGRKTFRCIKIDAENFPDIVEITEKEEVFSKLKKVFLSRFSIEENQVVPEALLKDDLDVWDMDFVGLIMSIEMEFGIDIPDDDAAKLVSVDDILCYTLLKLGAVS